MRTPRVRVRTRFVALAAAITLIASFSVASVLAVHDDGVFELDRNALDDAAAGDDWENIFDETDTADSTTGIDFDGRGPTIFTDGGSKDDLNTTSWKHKNGSSPDKDELLDALRRALRRRHLLRRRPLLTPVARQPSGFWFFQEEVGPHGRRLVRPRPARRWRHPVLSDFSVRRRHRHHPGLPMERPGWRHPPARARSTACSTCSPGDDRAPRPTVSGRPRSRNRIRSARPSTPPTASPWAFEPKDTAADIFAPGRALRGRHRPRLLPGADRRLLRQLPCRDADLAVRRLAAQGLRRRRVRGLRRLCHHHAVRREGNALSTIELGDEHPRLCPDRGHRLGAIAHGHDGLLHLRPDQLDDPVDDEDDPATCDVGGTAVSTNAVTEKASTDDGESISDAFEPDSTGTWCWRGEYSGDDNYPAATDASESECFNVVDARISLDPLVATNETGTDHEITALVEQDTGVVSTQRLPGRS